MAAYELYAEYRPNDSRQYIGGRANERAIIRLLARTLNSPTWPYGHTAVVYGPRGEQEVVQPEEANRAILAQAFPRDARV